MMHLLALVLAAATTPAPPPIQLGPAETIVFLGDSITQQNLYTAFVETFLISRLPERRLVFYNVGIGGNRVGDGVARFERDVAPLAPTVVLVNFGMNDGGYVPPDAEITRAYVEGQRTLADKIAALGARQILCAPSAVASRHARYLAPYNDTLDGLRRALAELAVTRTLPFFDLFSASRPLFETPDAAARFVPDGVHPNPAGHLVLAYAALERFDVPRGLGELVVFPTAVRASRPVAVTNVQPVPGALAFDLRMPFLPFYVPPEARAALAAVPFSDRLNRFRLRVDGWPGTRALALVVDGREVALLAPDERKGGVDLTALDDAPWAVQGRQLWHEAEGRYAVFNESWRKLGFDASPFQRDLVTTPVLVAAARAMARESGEHLRDIVRPRVYRVELRETEELVVRALELSPVYPWDLSQAGFDRADPPETAPDSVRWTSVPVKDRTVDLARALGPTEASVVYARLLLDASTPAELDLELGSNDGLVVVANGRRVLSHNVSRTVRLGDERVRVALARGRNVLLFRVSQVELRHGLALRARVVAGKPPADVRVVAPAR